MSRVVKKNVTERSRTKALVGNFKRCTVKDVHPHIKFIIPDDNVHNWYFMMGAMVDDDSKGQFPGNNDEFLHGQFFGKITATKMYPYGPPDVEMLTPTGVFPLNNSNFCIDIGKYHKDNYPSTLGMDGYTKMIWSGLVGWEDLGNGINLLSGTISKHKQLDNIREASILSQSYNKKNNARIVELFRSVGKEEEKSSKETTNTYPVDNIVSDVVKIHIDYNKKEIDNKYTEMLNESKKVDI